MVHALIELPVEIRDPDDLQRAAGRIRPSHVLVLRCIGAVLAGEPELFPDIPEAGARGALLLERLARADLWFALRDQLRAFATACNNAGLHELSTSAQETAEIAEHTLDTIRHRAAYPGLDHCRRFARLLTGLIWYCEAKEKSRRPAGPPRAPAAEPTPRKAAADARRKEKRKAELAALFKAWMRRRSDPTAAR